MTCSAFQDEGNAHLWVSLGGAWNVARLQLLQPANIYLGVYQAVEKRLPSRLGAISLLARGLPKPAKGEVFALRGSLLAFSGKTVKRQNRKTLWGSRKTVLPFYRFTLFPYLRVPS